MYKSNRKTLLLLIAMIGAVAVVMLRQYIFGDRCFVFQDIGSDTSYLYIAQYSGIIRHLQNGDFSFWDFQNGFGTNMFLYNMTNPALMIVYVIGALFGSEIVPYLMVYVYLAELILSGVCAYLFLSMFRFREDVKLVSALIYAFNGFILVWGQHYQFGILCILLPLELMMTERFLRSPKKWKGLVAMTVVLVFNSMYTAYMILLFTGCYVLVRELRDRKSPAAYVKRVIHAALVMVLGVGIAGVSLIPSAMAIAKVSDRLSNGGDTSVLSLLTQLYPRDYFVTLLNRMILPTARGVNIYNGYGNYYEGPCLFFTTLFLFLAVQYVFLLPGTKLSKRQKGIHVLVLAAGVSGIVFPYLGVIMNAFVKEFTRFFFLYMIYFAYISAFALQEIIVEKRLSLIGLLISLAFLLRFSAVLFLATNLSNGKTSIALTVFSGMLIGLLLLLLSGKTKHIRIGKQIPEKAAYTAFLVIIGINIYAGAWRNVNANSMTELMHSRLAVQKNGSYFQNMYDTDTLDAIDWLKENDTSFYRIEKMYQTTYAMDSVIQGYESVSTYNSTLNGNLRSYIQQYWGLLNFKDLNHFGIIAENGYLQTDQMELTGVKYVLRHKNDPDVPGYTAIKTVGSVEILEDTAVDQIASYYSGMEPVENAAEAVYDLRDKNADISMEHPENDGRVEAVVTAAEDGVLFAAIPYEAGWSVEVDGKSVDRIQMNTGFTGVSLTKGTHSVVYTYRAPGLFAGKVVTIMFALLFFVLCGVEKRHSGNDQ